MKVFVVVRRYKKDDYIGVYETHDKAINAIVTICAKSNCTPVWSQEQTIANSNAGRFQILHERVK